MKTSVVAASGCFGLLVVGLLLHSTRAESVTVNTGNDRARNDTDDVLGRLADSRVIGGAVVVQKDGKIAFAKGYGSASEVRVLYH